MRESGIHIIKRQRIASVLMLIATIVAMMVFPSVLRGAQENTVCYAVHVASFKNISGVYVLIKSLKRQGYKPFYVNVNIPDKGTWYRVFASFSESRNEAATCATRMKERGIIKKCKVLEIKRDIIPGNKNSITKHNAVVSQMKSEQTKMIRKSAPPAFPVVTKKPETLSLQNVQSDSKKQKRSEETVKDEAAQEYESGRYKSSLDRYRNMLQRKDLSPDQRETAVRRMADCYYQIGIKGERQAFFQAVEQYRRFITSYPENKDAIAVTRLRLAQCYDHLTMYYEAIRELRSLMAKYSDISCKREAIHLLATIYYKQKKYREAAEKFEIYVKHYRDAANIKTIYFTIGDCYSRINDFQEADKWYREALGRWPDVENLQPDDLRRLGMHYFRSGQYERAKRILFVYFNLYPGQKEAGGVMVAIAKAYIRTGDIPLGLKLLSLVIERYPGTDEAHESALTMANIGVTQPGIKLPRYIFSGICNYSNPIDTYSKTATTSSDRTVKEDVLFQRGSALAKKKRHEEAFNAFCDLLEQFRPGRRTKESKKNLVDTGEILVDRWFECKDYIAVADLYFRVRRNGLFEYGNFSMLYKIAESLKQMGLPTDAVKVLEEVKDMRISNQERGQILLAMANINFDMGRYDEAEKQTRMIMNDSKLSDRLRLQQARETMGDICYRKEMYKKAARFYSAIIGSGVLGDNKNRIYKKYADALKSGGFFPSALVNYKRALSSSAGISDDGTIRVDSYMAMGDCYFHEGRYEKSIEMYKKSLSHKSDKESSMWSLYRMGRGYVNLENIAEADHIFMSLQEKEQGEFWAALVDYCKDEKFWSDLYRHYAKN